MYYYNDNRITFGKYKGMLVTSILKIDPRYFEWCRNTIKYFKFSKRDYEIYLEWLSLCQNHLEFTGYDDCYKNIEFIFRQVKAGKFDDYPDDEFLTKETCKEYLNSTKDHYFRKK